MAYEDGRPVLQRKDTACCRNIVCKRRERVLHRRNVIAARLKHRNKLGPTAAICKCTVDKDDVLDMCVVLLCIADGGYDRESKGQSSSEYAAHDFVKHERGLHCHW